MSAHRFYYTELVGPIPLGMVVRHKCDTPACVNPAHLELGTQFDNMRDMVKRGRHRAWGSERVPPNKRLSDADVQAIRAASGSHAEVARQFQISRTHAWQIRTGLIRTA